MRTLFALAAAAVAITVAAPAMAQGQVTGSIGYTGMKTTDAPDVTLGAITGRVGYRQGWLGAEGEFSSGVKDDSFTVAGVPTKVQLKDQFAVYGMAIAPITPNFDVFARLGYGQTKTTSTDNSVNYGAGAEYFFDGKNGVRADYTRHDFQNNGTNFDTYGVSYVRKF